MTGHKYKILWRIDLREDGLTKDEIEALPDHPGACDAALISSVIRNPDGSTSTLFIGMDGNTGQGISDEEIFKIWCLLAMRLSESDTLGPSRSGLCGQVHAAVKEALTRARTNHQ